MPAEAFYGLFRQNLPTRLPALLAQHPQVLRLALETAIRANIIPARLQGEIDTILERFQQLIVEHAFEEPEGGRTSIGALLSTTIASRDIQQKVLTAYVKHQGPIEGFWMAMRADPQVAGVVDDLQFTLRLATLTDNHLPLVRELQRMRQEGTFASLRDLAKLDVAAWMALINKYCRRPCYRVPSGHHG